MPALRTAVDIAASRAETWGVLTDFGRYGEWNPLLRSVEGELVRGARIRFGVKLPCIPVIHLWATVEDVEPERRFDWSGMFLSSALFKGTHQFILRSDVNGGTRFDQHEHYSGWCSFLIVPFLPMLHRGFTEMNRSLKAHIELRGGAPVFPPA